MYTLLIVKRIDVKSLLAHKFMGDTAKFEHLVRAQSFRGVDLGEQLKLENNKERGWLSKIVSASHVEQRIKRIHFRHEDDG